MREKEKIAEETMNKLVKEILKNRDVKTVYDVKNNLLKIGKELLNGTYTFSEYFEFIIKEKAKQGVNFCGFRIWKKIHF